MKWHMTFGMVFLAFSAIGEIITVGSNGTYQTIIDGYNACKEGDTLYIQSGEYTIELWQINKPITLLGEKQTELISSNGNEIIKITSSDVTIKSIIFSGVITNYLKENAAIRVKECRRVIIENNVFNDCFYAIYLERAYDAIIRQNTISGNATTEVESGNGIHAWYCDNIDVINNKISRQRDGIYFEFVNNSLVKDNHSFNNTRYGLHYMFSNDDQYVNNIFEANGVGVAVMFSRRINMSGNRFTHNWGHSAYGLLLKEIYDADIVDNTFNQNTIGIFVEGSNRIKYLDNDFVRNGWAIKFSGGCDANEITQNNFLYNSIDMVVSSQLNNNTIHHNYWSEYTGYDLDKDGIGDIPYYPVKLYSYIINQVPEAVVLMRSLFVDIINYAEKISPVFTPKNVMDKFPKMYK